LKEKIENILNYLTDDQRDLFDRNILLFLWLPKGKTPGVKLKPGSLARILYFKYMTGLEVS